MQNPPSETPNSLGKRVKSARAIRDALESVHAETPGCAPVSVQIPIVVDTVEVSKCSTDCGKEDEKCLRPLNGSFGAFEGYYSVVPFTLRVRVTCRQRFES